MTTYQIKHYQRRPSGSSSGNVIASTDFEADDEPAAIDQADYLREQSGVASDYAALCDASGKVIVCLGWPGGHEK